MKRIFFSKQKMVWIGSMLLLMGFGMGCQSTAYYTQAIAGHLDLLMQGQPLERLIHDADTPEDLKQKLALVMEIRKFADQSLALPLGQHYLKYVALDRPYVVWNVFAAPEFSLSPVTWCYPFVGCVAYRAYFREADAQAYAGTLAEEGYDVFVGGVTAYSTLGWFDDPVLSTFIDQRHWGLAALIFHELAHQVLYVPDDTAFNESFAVAVEIEGLLRWLQSRGDSASFARYRMEYAYQEQFLALLMRHRDRLAALYRQPLQAEYMRLEKARLLAQLKEDYLRRKQDWNQWTDFDAWFARPVNNARLALVSMYHIHVPAFRRLLEKHNGDFAAFYETCRQLAEKVPEERIAALKALGEAPLEVDAGN